MSHRTTKHTRQFEERLRSFRPVAPRGLAISSRRAAVACSGRGCGSTGGYRGSLRDTATHPRGESHAPTISTAVPRPMVAPPITIGRLNAALRGGDQENDQDLTQMLDDASPRLASPPTSLALRCLNSAKNRSFYETNLRHHRALCCQHTQQPERRKNPSTATTSARPADNAALRYWMAFAQMNDSPISAEDAAQMDAIVKRQSPVG